MLIGKATKVLGTSIVLAACGTAMGCGAAVQPLGNGQVALSWQVSPRGCKQSDVEKVQLRLKNSYQTYTESYDCTVGGALIKNVQPGNYTLTMSGIDPGGHETFISGAHKVTVRPDVVNKFPSVPLTAKPAQLEVDWVFANGRVCGANHVDAVQVSVFDPSDFEVANKSFSCNAGSAMLQGIVPGSYLVQVVAQTPGGASLQGQQPTSLKRGDHGRVQVTLGSGSN